MSLDPARILIGPVLPNLSCDSTLGSNGLREQEVVSTNGDTHQPGDCTLIRIQPVEGTRLMYSGKNLVRQQHVVLDVSRCWAVGIVVDLQISSVDF